MDFATAPHAVAFHTSDGEGVELHGACEHASLPWRWCRMAGSLFLVLLLGLLPWMMHNRSTASSADADYLALLAASTFQCCGRGIEGTQGPCIRGSEGSVCSAGDIPILCSASSTAYLNIHGHPFCCGPGWTGCSNVCVDQGRRSSILMSGRTCNDVAPQGLRTPGRIQHLDMPWDGQLQRYRFGDRVARVDGLAVPRGRDNLTITATLTPRRDGGVGYGQIWSVLALRFNADPEFIFGIFLGFADSGDRTDMFSFLEQTSV